jgi:hypothetical protein
LTVGACRHSMPLTWAGAGALRIGGLHGFHEQSTNDKKLRNSIDADEYPPHA